MRIQTAFFLLSSLSACASADAPSDKGEKVLEPVSARHPLFEKTETNIALTPELQAHRFTEIYFSGQPSLSDLQALKEAGFVAVINLRSPAEYDEAKEEAAASAAGLAYKNVPFAKSDELSDEFLDKVTGAVVAHRSQGKVLVHCSSGNRVGLWIGGHFAKDHGMRKEEAEAMAKHLGLQKPGAINKLQSYFENLTTFSE